VEILKVCNLSKVYGKGDTQIKALDDVSFSVQKGEFVAIVGPSGSGKSTLLHILGGVDTPSSGEVLVDGTDICTLDKTKLAIFRRRQLGLIYQFYNLIPILDVEENITLPLLLDERKLDAERLKEIVATLGLADRVRHLPNQLSGGQQQRVSIGRALINNPALVLADEPTGNLDSSNSKEVIALLKLSNRRYHQTLIMVTHDRDIALQADRIISFGDGRIVRDERVAATSAEAVMDAATATGTATGTATATGVAAAAVRA
jgi:putative ABC transport system ATP-binding protein